MVFDVRLLLRRTGLILNNNDWILGGFVEQIFRELKRSLSVVAMIARIVTKMR